MTYTRYLVCFYLIIHHCIKLCWVYSQVDIVYFWLLINCPLETQFKVVSAWRAVNLLVHKQESLSRSKHPKKPFFHLPHLPLVFFFLDLFSHLSRLFRDALFGVRDSKVRMLDDNFSLGHHNQSMVVSCVKCRGRTLILSRLDHLSSLSWSGEEFPQKKGKWSEYQALGCPETACHFLTWLHLHQELKIWAQRICEQGLGEQRKWFILFRPALLIGVTINYFTNEKTKEHRC